MIEILRIVGVVITFCGMLGFLIRGSLLGGLISLQVIVSGIILVFIGNGQETHNKLEVSALLLMIIVTITLLCAQGLILSVIFNKDKKSKEGATQA